MQENNINIEKLEKLFNIFVKDVGEEYFTNLQNIYDILQDTLLNKEYVENLTEEKLDGLINKNKTILKYFDCFNYPDLENYVTGNCYIFEDSITTAKPILFKRFVNFLNIKETENRIIKYFVVTDGVYKEVIADFSFFINLLLPKMLFSNSITKFNKISDFTINDVSCIDNILQRNKNLVLKNIPTGIFFFHFCKWYDEDYIEKIVIKDYYTLKNVELNNFNSKEIYLLGENGAGKTILLQKIFNFTKDKKYTYAYGVHRNRITTSKEGVKPESDTLFSSDAELNDPEKWLMKLKLRENKTDSYQINFETATEMLSSLFEENIQIKEIDGEIVFIENNNHTVRFNELATGYQSVLIWVIDLIIRMSQKQKYVSKLEHYKGTVLIDELDLFLHPKWAYKIMAKLRGWFPRVRFIISTHSPVLILGASKDAIIYKVSKNENGNTEVSEPYYFKDYQNLTSNAFLTAPFMFDMEFSGTREMKDTDFYKNKLDTSGSFNIYKINKAVEKRVKEIRKEKNIQITEEDIDGWINEAIAKQEGGEE